MYLFFENTNGQGLVYHRETKYHRETVLIILI